MGETKDQVCVQDAGVEKYKEKIAETISSIQDTWILRQVYDFIINMTKEGD